MGVADSPLKDRVVFVTGSQRSGTTWLATMLSVHPDIAGSALESHLFDFGVDRLFDNHEDQTPQRTFLRGYVSEDELVDLVRELCDGVLGRMHARTKPEARLIVEKTPVGSEGRALVEIERKLQCFPDARYIHIVRDREAVVDSMLRTPWLQGRSRAECQRLWDETVEAISSTLRGHPGYVEVSYEELREDPVEGSAGLFRWLGIAAGEDVLARVGMASRQHYSRWRVEDTGAQRPDAGRLRKRMAGRSPRGLVRSAVARSRAGRTARADLDAENGWPAAAHEFVEAFSAVDAETLAALLTDACELTLRMADGDAHVRSAEAALPVLTALADRVFGTPFVHITWSPAAAPLHNFWFSGVRSDGSRVDLSVGLRVEGDGITDVAVLSAGNPDGRQPTEWIP